MGRTALCRLASGLFSKAKRSGSPVIRLSARTSEAMHTAMAALDQLQQQADALTHLLTDMKNPA